MKKNLVTFRLTRAKSIAGQAFEYMCIILHAGKHSYNIRGQTGWAYTCTCICSYIYIYHDIILPSNCGGELGGCALSAMWSL